MPDYKSLLLWTVLIGGGGLQASAQESSLPAGKTVASKPRSGELKGTQKDSVKAFREAIQQIFLSTDGNQDGFLEIEEFAYQPQFGKADLNRDGRLSTEEFREHYLAKFIRLNLPKGLNPKLGQFSFLHTANGVTQITMHQELLERNGMISLEMNINFRYFTGIRAKDPKAAPHQDPSPDLELPFQINLVDLGKSARFPPMENRKLDEISWKKQQLTGIAGRGDQFLINLDKQRGRQEQTVRVNGRLAGMLGQVASKPHPEVELIVEQGRIVLKVPRTPQLDGSTLRILVMPIDPEEKPAFRQIVATAEEARFY